MNVEPTKTSKDEAKKQVLLDELLKQPLMVLETAFVYATNYLKYGEDVTKAWTTAIQNSSALERAYNIGYYEGLKRCAESEVKDEL